jgi:hypothetical protein
MTLSDAQSTRDNIDDELGSLLRRIGKIKTLTKVKEELLTAAEERARQEGYLRFSGGFRTYILQRRGSHCLITVPADQKGALQVFREKRVRLICVAYGHNISSRIYMAKPL